jgi:hypothetical protein
MLFQVDTGYACGGIVVHNNVCTHAPPIFKWMIGRTLDEIMGWPKIQHLRRID